MSESARMLRSLLLERSRLKADWDRLGAARQSLEPTSRALAGNAAAIAEIDLASILRERSEWEESSANWQTLYQQQHDLSAALIEVLTDWGFVAEGSGIDGGEDLAEALRERGAWRMARDIRAALDRVTPPDSPAKETP